MTKVKFDTKGIEKKVARYKKKAKKELPKVLQKAIVETIQSGQSPVEGFKFEPYSDVYLDEIENGKYFNFSKRKSPVNMTLSGDMLNSFFVKDTNKGVQLGFDNSLAEIHNSKGAGKSKVIRRLLPTNKGERFKRTIRSDIREVLQSIIKKIFKSNG